MSKPWKILSRRNADALASGSVYRSIPAYVAPVVIAFRAHHVNSKPELQGSEHAFGLVGSTVYFYFEITDPDGFVYEYVFASDEGEDVVLTPSDLESFRYKGGYLLTYRYMYGYSYYPTITVRWRINGVTQAPLVVQVSNPPVEIKWLYVWADPTEVMMGDPVTLEYEDPQEIDSTVVEWGD